MTDSDRAWLLQHLDAQARTLASLTAYAHQHPEDSEVLFRVRDEIFTMRETLDTLAVPNALIDNGEWRRVPHASHRAPWPSEEDLRR